MADLWGLLNETAQFGAPDVRLMALCVDGSPKAAGLVLQSRNLLYIITVFEPRPNQNGQLGGIFKTTNR